MAHARTIVALGIALLAAAAAPAAAQPARPARPAAIVPAPGLEPATARGGEPLAPERTVELFLYLRGRRAAELDRVARAVSDPASASYGHFLSVEDVRRRYAPSRAALRAVVAWARAAGLRVLAVPGNRSYVALLAPAARLDDALHVHLHAVSAAQGGGAAPDRTPRLPPALARMVVGIAGVPVSGGSDTVASPSSAVGKPAPPGCAPPGTPVTEAGLPPAQGLTTFPREFCGYTPETLPGALGLPASLRAGSLDGRGQTVAVIGRHVSPTLRGDLARWSALHGLPAPQLQIQEYPANTTAEDSLNGQLDALVDEQTLDLEAVHAIAPGARLLFVDQGEGDRATLTAALNDIVSRRSASIVSISFAAAEGRYPGPDQADPLILAQGAAEGIGFYAASGDNGKGDRSARIVSYPAASPRVTAVGGTTLLPGVAGGPVVELPWGTSESVLTGGAWAPVPPGAYRYSSGGGTALFQAQPAYQRSVVPRDVAYYWRDHPDGPPDTVTPGRALPDVASVGDPDTGLLTGQTVRYPDGSDRYLEYRQAGTSLATPVVAGLVALADQAAGRRHGFVNPLLYTLAGSRALHDVAPGPPHVYVRKDWVNGIDATRGVRTALRTGQSLDGLSSGPGYDTTTGLGSPDGLAFLRALAPGAGLLAGTPAPAPRAPAADLDPARRPVGPVHARHRGRCRPTVRIALRPPRGRRIVAIVVYVDGLRRSVRHGRDLRALLVRRPGRGAVSVTLAIRTDRGPRLRLVRRITACPR